MCQRTRGVLPFQVKMEAFLVQALVSEVVWVEVDVVVVPSSLAHLAMEALMCQIVVLAPRSQSSSVDVFPSFHKQPISCQMGTLQTSHTGPWCHKHKKEGQ